MSKDTGEWKCTANLVNFKKSNELGEPNAWVDTEDELGSIFKLQMEIVKVQILEK